MTLKPYATDASVYVIRHDVAGTFEINKRCLTLKCDVNVKTSRDRTVDIGNQLFTNPLTALTGKAEGVIEW